MNQIRKELLSVKGIGCETADSILLYAFDYPSFVIDAYTVRLLQRLGITMKYDYQTIKDYFENELTANIDLYKNFHATIVINGKECCKKTPTCNECPLLGECINNVNYRS